MPADSVSRMDPSGSGTEDNAENGLNSSPGTSGLRYRTESEGSEKQTRFVLPSTDGSPPKVLTLDEVVHVVKNIQNMTLAHEIALNPEFKLEPYEPPENSLERKIKEVMHKAFWDVLREQLNATPPCYDNAIQLLSDIKECFPQIISANNSKILDHINSVLDTALIRQQAEQGVLDFRAYANFVIQIMAKSCAPARDEQIKKLSEEVDVIETFRGILEIMTVMKLDMANFLLDFARNDILVNSVEYEKEKFREYLEYYKFGFPATENWLKRHQAAGGSHDQIVYNAFIELINWNEENDFPEVLSNDKDRILKLGSRALRLCVSASAHAICSGISILNQSEELKKSLATQIPVLLQSVSKDSELEDAMQNIFVHIRMVINDRLKEIDQQPLTVEVEDSIRNQIIQISKKEFAVRNLMWNRLLTYFRLMFVSKNNPPPPPPGYVDFQDELESFAASLKRVISYNNSVFGDYFRDVLNNDRSVGNVAAVTNDENPK